MKNTNKARLIIFTLGLVLLTAVFVITLLPANSHQSLSIGSASSLPEGVHIPININTADKETLCLLDGIGNTLAERIIAYREDHGNFKEEEEIIEVYGIGEKTYQKIKNYICIE